MLNLFAACRNNGQLLVKRVPLDRSVQEAVEEMFTRQERQFRENVTDEVPFDGDWKAESNEVLTLGVPGEARVFVDVMKENAIAIPTIDTSNFDQEGIRALFTTSETGGKSVVLIQLFTIAQVLSRKFPLVMRGNTFRELTDPSFAFGAKLEGIIEDDVLKFKSFFNVRKIIGSMSAHFRAATDKEMREFAAHESIEVENVESFIELADETTRKLVRAVAEAKTLDKYSTTSVVEAARSVGVELNARGDRLVLPTKRAELKRVVRFLDDGLYEAPLTRRRYETNSKKLVR